MEVKVRHTGGVRFEIATRSHTIVSDQPAGNAGADTGMTPPELLLASLGACAGFYAAQYMRNHRLPQDGLEVTVSSGKAAAPARLNDFHIDVIAPGLPAEHEAGILRAVNACLIKNTLAIPPTIETVLHTHALAGA
jgi:putative redox protein